MNSYLLTVLVKRELDEKKRKELLDSLTNQMDKLESEELWGVKSLSYPIKHQTSAYYVHYRFQADPKKLAALDKSIKFNEDILRYLITRSEDKKIRSGTGRAKIVTKPKGQDPDRVVEAGGESSQQDV